MNTKLIPTIIQDAQTGLVYMLGYSNRESLCKTKKTGFVYLWSRSRKSLWKKGATSGNTLTVISIANDCDNDTLLFKVNLNGTAVCHNNTLTCFTRQL